MAQLLIIKRVIGCIEAPKVAAHLVKRRKVCIFCQLELLLEVNDLLARFDLEKLGSGHLDHDSVAVRPRHGIVLLEHFDQVFNFA